MQSRGKGDSLTGGKLKTQHNVPSSWSYKLRKFRGREGKRKGGKGNAEGGRGKQREASTSRKLGDTVSWESKKLLSQNGCRAQALERGEKEK